MNLNNFVEAHYCFKYALSLKDDYPKVKINQEKLKEKTE